MPELKTRDGLYLFADQDDGHVVLYDLQLPEGNNAIWADGIWLGTARPAAPHPPAPPPAPRPPDAPPTPVALGAPGVIRVTDARDGDLVNRGYSYRPQAVVRGDVVIVFVGHADGTPRLYQVGLIDGAVVRLGWRFPYRGTAEGYYWSGEGWIYLCDGPRLRRVNPFNGEDQIVFSIEDTHPGCRIFQTHSSEDGQTHSATVQRIVEDGPYPNIGTVVYWQGEQQFFPAHGTLDESAITPDGGYLVIKEDNDNRIITLGTRETRLLRDADGAVGHSDCGPGILVGEDDQHGACVLWDLRHSLSPIRRRELFRTWHMGHVSVRAGRILISDDTWLSLVQLFPEGGSTVTYLLRHGMVSDGTYDTQVFANLDPTGQVACYCSNVAGRLDAYLLVL